MVVASVVPVGLVDWASEVDMADRGWAGALVLPAGVGLGREQEEGGRVVEAAEEAPGAVVARSLHFLCAGTHLRLCSRHSKSDLPGGTERDHRGTAGHLGSGRGPQAQLRVRCTNCTSTQGS